MNFTIGEDGLYNDYVHLASKLTTYQIERDGKKYEIRLWMPNTIILPKWVDRYDFVFLFATKQAEIDKHGNCYVREI